MRVACIGLLVAACGGAPAPVGVAAPAPAPVAARAARAPAAAGPADDDGDAPPVDALVELARDPHDVGFGWVAPRQVMLERRGAPIYTPTGTPPQYVEILEHHGDELRIGLRLDAGRVALWTDTTGLFGAIKREVRVGESGGYVPVFGEDAPEAVLRAGARVTVLGRDGARTHVRYTGQVEIDGWIPSDAVGDRFRGGGRVGRAWRFSHTLTVLPGTAIRSEPQWSGRVLAVMVGVHGYFIDDVRDLGDDRHEVAYSDADVIVRGFASTREPPESIRGRRDEAPPPPAPPTPPTATVASGTCLYARAHGEAIGFIVGDAAVDLEPVSGSWFAITLDTPWGAITFAAQGASPTDLVACAPAGSVPLPQHKPANVSVP